MQIMQRPRLVFARCRGVLREVCGSGRGDLGRFTFNRVGGNENHAKLNSWLPAPRLLRNAKAPAMGTGLSLVTGTDRWRLMPAPDSNHRPFLACET